MNVFGFIIRAPHQAWSNFLKLKKAEIAAWHQTEEKKNVDLIKKLQIPFDSLVSSKLFHLVSVACQILLKKDYQSGQEG